MSAIYKIYIGFFCFQLRAGVWTSSGVSVEEPWNVCAMEGKKKRGPYVPWQQKVSTRDSLPKARELRELSARLINREGREDDVCETGFFTRGRGEKKKGNDQRKEKGPRGTAGLGCHGLVRTDREQIPPTSGPKRQGAVLGALEYSVLDHVPGRGAAHRNDTVMRSASTTTTNKRYHMEIKEMSIQ